MGILDPPIRILDGGDVTQGTTSDTSAALTVIGRLKNLLSRLPEALSVNGGLVVESVKGNQIVNTTVTIPNAGSLSTSGGDAAGVLDLRKKCLVGLQMPSAWTAALITFDVSMDGGITFSPLYDALGAERSLNVVALRSISLDPTNFMGCTHLKIRSGTAATPVNQGAARVINVTTIAL